MKKYFLLPVFFFLFSASAFAQVVPLTGTVYNNTFLTCTNHPSGDVAYVFYSTAHLNQSFDVLSADGDQCANIGLPGNASSLWSTVLAGGNAAYFSYGTLEVISIDTTQSTSDNGQSIAASSVGSGGYNGSRSGALANVSNNGDSVISDVTFTAVNSNIPIALSGMSSTTAATLISDTTTSFGLSALVVLTAIIAVAVGLLVIYWGWRTMQEIIEGKTNGISRLLYGVNSNLGSKFDQLTYKPYKGYNRLRSRKWNMEHMP